MLLQVAGLVRGEVAALRDDFGWARAQVDEIAAWLEVEPVDVALAVATAGGVLAYMF